MGRTCTVIAELVEKDREKGEGEGEERRGREGRAESSDRIRFKKEGF